jgi:signal transduction histidine kinase
MSRPHVLVVDDDPALAENVAEILTCLGVDLTLAGSGGEALRKVTGREVDLALVDVRLPDGPGIDLGKRLRSGSPLPELVLITADATVESAIAALHTGAFAYVLKPFSPQDLLDTARRALSQVSLYKERERLQRELERSERRNREIIEAVPAFVLALDAEGRIAVWNRRLEEATGYARDEVIGRPGSELVKADGVRRLPLKDGKELLVRWERASVRLPDSDATWTYAVGTDVTAEQEMLRRTLRAERLAAVGTLAAGLAHEVRNPLNSAILQLDVLSRRLDRGEHTPESIRPVADLVRQEIRRLEHLVNDFLAFVQPRPLDLKPTELSTLCRDVLAFVQPEAEAVEIHLDFEIAADVPPLAADPERLRQVLLNLVRNGIEAMPDGGALTIRARTVGSQVEIDIQDTGVGFADEAPIFDAFFTTKSQGTGLGLTIVHRIVTDHGGSMRVRSTAGDTCFTVSLPVSVPVAARASES